MFPVLDGISIGSGMCTRGDMLEAISEDKGSKKGELFRVGVCDDTVNIGKERWRLRSFLSGFFLLER